MLNPTFDIEDQHQGIIAGVDEVGYGAWAGPVVSAAVIIDRKTIDPFLLTLINDSKKLSKPRRDKAFSAMLQSESIISAVGIVGPHEIDQINIKEAAHKSMKIALNALSKKPDVVLVDGIVAPNIDTRTVAIKGGDALSFSIAAASIIAKVTRDQIMAEWSKKYPDYGFERHVGYGTAYHLEALKTFGVTDLHRKSYKPIQPFLVKEPLELSS